MCDGEVCSGVCSGVLTSLRIDPLPAKAIMVRPMIRQRILRLVNRKNYTGAVLAEQLLRSIQKASNP
jgi:hypothetical protein